MPKNARTFIKETITFLDEKFTPEKYVIFIFGSMITKDYSRGTKGTSDVDLLVVINDDIENKAIKQSWNEINAIENRIFSPRKKWSIIPRILRLVESQTGMHNNTFITSLKDLERMDFSRIFHTNKVLTRLIAPNTIVLGSALTNITCLHGSEMLAAKVVPIKAVLEKKKITAFELLKSLVMDATLSFCSIILLPITHDATRYSVEAMKWSLYSSTYALTGKRPSKRIQARFFEKMGINPGFLKRWIQLSENYTRDVKFSLKALFTTLKIHVLGLKMMR